MPELLYIPWFKLEPWAIGPLKLQPFGLMVALGILFGSRVGEWRAEKTGVPPALMASFFLYTIAIGLPMGMLLNVVFYTPERFLNPKELFTTWPGMSSYGGFMSGVGAAFLFRARKRASILVFGDIFCFAFPFAWLLCRTGCFVVHDHPGLVTDFFLAVDNYREQGQPRHDLGLYEVLWSAAVIPIVWWLGKKPRKRGFFMALVPILYAPFRFPLDYLRIPESEGGDARYFGLTPAQYASVLLLIAGILVARRVAKGPEPQSWHLDGPEAAAKAEAALGAETDDAHKQKTKKGR